MANIGDETNETDFAFVADDVKENEWWIDSGASRHMTDKKKDMLGYKKLKEPIRINLADNSVVLGIGTGDVIVKLYDGTKIMKVKQLLSLPVLLKRKLM